MATLLLLCDQARRPEMRSVEKWPEVSRTRVESKYAAALRFDSTTSISANGLTHVFGQGNVCFIFEPNLRYGLSEKCARRFIVHARERAQMIRAR